MQENPCFAQEGTGVGKSNSAQKIRKIFYTGNRTARFT